MRTTPRPRRYIRPLAFVLLRPVLRFSYTREAYVLRAVGNHRGPVFVRHRVTPDAPRPAPTPDVADVTDGRKEEHPAQD
jgi:hypothetical protein